jgi:hypothetical protein
VTRYPIKTHSLRVNQVYGHIQLGDLTYYESSYKDFLPITDPLVKPPKKKQNVPFTMSPQPFTSYSFADGKQYLDYLDNNILVPICNGVL